ncbi:hypothetical protein [Gracilibacillus sp. YIM 98692]|uniref:hypothetical protein n=1 Tax=Gracilibacillus sp. YIM 98692 TaxID=2663532 RepID=UPI0013D070BD|nr:hypothetical protein [Gracilibacillus sp. YIM 98692]
MIPLELQDALRQKLEKLFDGMRFKNMKNERVPVNVFEQHLPNKNPNLNPGNDDPYPCIIIRLSNGENPNEDEGQRTTVQFIAGVIDRDNNNQGYHDVLNIINRIIEDLRRNPIINEKFEVDSSMTWSYHDEDVEPYFFAGLETYWTNPQNLREDVERFI